MKKYLIFSFFVLVIANLAVADTYTVSKTEQSQMLNEADDWIDDMPDGIQDRLSDAVSHAVQGFYNEINYFRNMSDTVGASKYPVIVKDYSVNSSSADIQRLYIPKKKKQSGSLPLLIYFHGGGWSLGSVNATDKFCRALAAEGNMMVVSLEYPLAPEHPYPQAILQACETIKLILNYHSQWGFDINKVSLGGDGSGGNLALEAFENLPSSISIKNLVLYYPILNYSPSLDPASKRSYGRGYGFDSRLLEAFLEAYKGNLLTIKKELPPVLLISAGRDILIKEEEDFSKINNVKWVVFADAIHGFISDGKQKTAFKKAVSLTDIFLTSEK